MYELHIDRYRTHGYVSLFRDMRNDIGKTAISLEYSMCRLDTRSAYQSVLYPPLMRGTASYLDMYKGGSMYLNDESKDIFVYMCFEI